MELLMPSTTVKNLPYISTNYFGCTPSVVRVYGSHWYDDCSMGSQTIRGLDNSYGEEPAQNPYSTVFPACGIYW